MIKAILRYREDQTLLNAIIKSLEPDNKKTPQYLRIESEIQDNTLYIKVVIDGKEEKIGTLLNTLDEILALMKAVEKTILAVRLD